MLKEEELSNCLSQQIPFMMLTLPSENGQKRSFDRLGIELNLSSFSMKPFSDESKGIDDFVMNESEYISRVQSLIDEMKSGFYEKAVFSRIIQVPRNAQHTISKIYNRLAEKYPNAFVFAIQNNEGQLWMGASPEYLFRRKGNICETMALAATQKKKEGFSLSDYEWNVKERHEHDVVVSFLQNKLSNLVCKKIEVGPTLTAAAGNLVHLKTIISFETQMSDHDLALNLHPTPAVCGMPTKEAMDAIFHAEPHDRSYYTGYIGVNLSKTESIYLVNLRSMKVHTDHFSIYVGGGITARSIAENEWKETEIKSRTMLDCIS